ncbi:acyltransferase family protein [Prescottella equi]|uniref:acyltransferase family protein n=1 Tax=Rhodococcus hoagii TaxID=43767 RepID=UPI002742381D|nr:acyltransferase [Prescottella equi]MDP8016042.1 acyltransferase [Prescottella equi]
MKNRIAHIDAMRAIAVLLVVVGHAGLGRVVPGGAGVTVFFAISGFIITTLLLKEWTKDGSFDIGGFYVRRAVKLVPPLVVALIVPTLIYVLCGGTIGWNAFAGQVLFYFNWVKLDHPDVFPGSAVVWSLSIEEQFYIVFAVLWLWLVRSRRAVSWLTVIAVAVVLASTTLRILIADSGNGAVADRIYYGSDTRADSLAWGILAAVALFKWQQSKDGVGWVPKVSGNDWALATAVFVFLLSLVIRDDWFRQTFRYTLQSVTTCVIILYGFAAARSVVYRVFVAFCRIRVVQAIGLASYSIYLVHLTLIVAIDDYTKRLPLPVHVAISIAVSIAVGYAMYRFVEVPVRNNYNTRRRRKTEHQEQPMPIP